MSLKALRIVHAPEGGRVMLLEHHQHGLAEVLEAEEDGHYVIQVRRVPERDRALKLRALDAAERILAGGKQDPPPTPRGRLGKMHRRASGGGA
jgi:hypothetical protein